MYANDFFYFFKITHQNDPKHTNHIKFKKKKKVKIFLGMRFAPIPKHVLTITIPRMILDHLSCS
jgi:hypothetical protein